MSKYIRTKNNQVVDLDTMEFDWAFPRENFVKAHAVKQADTIEELCDEFVIIADDKPYIRVPAGNTNFQTYGAIWTDKGLIYVAKMNEKGELELL